MAANSKHPGDIDLWIRKIIDSCETPSQMIGAKEMIYISARKLFPNKLASCSCYWYERSLMQHYSSKLKQLLNNLENGQETTRTTT